MSTLSRQFTCHHCNRGFSTKGNLSRHIQATHVGGKTFPCPTCGKEFKRKEDRNTHLRIHTGEKPYKCEDPSCGRKFARISDLRSHERTHGGNSKAFICSYPGCLKKFTRPYDLKKHEMNQHQGFAMAKQLGSGNALATSVSNERAKRPITESDSRKIPQPAATAELEGSQPIGLESCVSQQESSSRVSPGKVVVFVRPHGREVGHQPHPPPKQQQQQQQQQQYLQLHVEQPQASNATRQRVDEPQITQTLPPTPAFVNPPASTAQTHFRKRVRCDAHKHCHPAADVEGERGDTTVVRGEEWRHGVNADVYREGGGGQKIASFDISEAKAHVHGATCGHVAVLHEDHIDFLVGGQLECYGGREGTSDRWVSSSKEGSGNAGFGCEGDVEAVDGSITHATHGSLHWDGARTDRGQCIGETHGPQCGHDIIHHAGHLDYVINGRLIHPLDPLGVGSNSASFEDHGSIKPLENECVTFIESLAVLSENANQAVESYCDLCDKEREQE